MAIQLYTYKSCGRQRRLQFLEKMCSGARGLPEEQRRRRGLGIEPMTAAPDAFNSGDGLLVLEPRQTHTATWELRPASD